MQLQKLFAMSALLLAVGSPCFGQGTFGIGARLSMVRGDVNAVPAATAQRLAATGTNAVTTGLASRFLPSYDGSMWTAGVTFYF
jgi:hypothetical protein